MPINSFPINVLVPVLAFGFVSPVLAEVRTITATGKYRMGDNDTRSDAKRLALLDAKRLALEQAGTYLESLTEVKNLQVTHDELRAYAAGIIEVVEHTTKDVMEGATHIVRVQVTAKIDKTILTKQIIQLHSNVSTKRELTGGREKRDRLERELEVATRELSTPKSNKEVVVERRQQLLNQVDVNDLLVKAWAELVPFEKGELLLKETTADGLLRAKEYAQKAVALDHASAEAHYTLGVVLRDEGNPKAAASEFQEAIRSNPDNLLAHEQLAMVLSDMGDLSGTISEWS